MKFEIKHKLSGKILFSIETETMKMAVEAAIKQKANLSYANLRYADLRYANLRCADLLIFQYQRHQAICAGERLTIGCHDKPLAEWACDYEEIGREAGYTDLQIQMYGKFIEMCVEAQT